MATKSLVRYDKLLSAAALNNPGQAGPLRVDWRGEGLAVPARLMEARRPAALGSAPPFVLALAREVLRSMTTIANALAIGALGLVTGALLAAGTRMSGKPENPRVNSPAAPAPAAPLASPAGCRHVGRSSSATTTWFATSRNC